MTTAREAEVLELLLGDHTVAEIAQALHLSPHTVSHHIARLRTRHGARSTRDLVVGVWRDRALAWRDERDQCRKALAVLDRRGARP